MKKETHSAIDRYMNRVFKLVVLALPGVAVCAGVTFTLLKLGGCYADVSGTSLAVFDATNIAYLALGIYFVLKCEDENGVLKSGFLNCGKLIIAVAEIIQWNYISYMIPSRDFWGYSVFFVLLITVFLDSKYVLAVIGALSVSIAVSWFARGDMLLPVNDVNYTPNMVLRVVCIFLSFAAAWIITYLVETRLSEELETISEFDELTKLRNRRSMYRLIPKLIAEHAETPYSVIMGDIDDFKQINDTYGHICGDEILKLVSSVIERNVCGSGVAFRFGGEEFLIWAEMDKDGAVRLAEKIRKEVEGTVYDYSETAVSVTVTLGLVSAKGAVEFDKLLKTADDRMYYGKKHGKNIVISSDVPKTPETR